MAPSRNLSITTYNVKGLSDNKWDYVRNLISSCNFLLIQETWLHSSQFHVITDNIANVSFDCVSGMSETELHAGRPYGGCAIVWHNSMRCSVTPIHCKSKRVCCVRARFPHLTALIFSVYMPCDTQYDVANVEIFNDVLNEISSIASMYESDRIICAGDFNTDFSRTRSLHTRALSDFLSNEDLCSIHVLPGYSVDYTFESASDRTRSTLDHFFISENLRSSVVEITCHHDVDNFSDHSPLICSFNSDVETCTQSPRVID